MTPALPNPSPPYLAFTWRHSGLALALITDVEIFPAFVPSAVPPQGIKYKALFDTGATHSVISPKVVADLKLPSIGITNVGVGGGKLTTTSHLVNFGFPNRVMFSMFRVAALTVRDDADAAIGMDILGRGDFAVTNHGGKTTFSFCCPPRREIDFVGEITADQVKIPVRFDKVGRNDPCPCGSNKKYKKCHGR